MSDHPHSIEFFPNIQSEPPLEQLCVVPARSVLALAVYARTSSPAGQEESISGHLGVQKAA